MTWRFKLYKTTRRKADETAVIDTRNKGTIAKQSDACVNASDS